MEHLRLRAADGGVVATGFVLALDESRPFRLHYKIKCDNGWHTRKVIFELHTPNSHMIRTLRADGQGTWRREDGSTLPELDGCLDVDMTATPFTNTLAIRRLELQPGASSDIRVAYLTAPRVRLRAASHRYSRPAGAPNGTVRFESPADNLRADLPLDSDGLVLDYPELFRRVYPTR
jgi:hypothetical protein